jgi:cytochrome c peroxidase
VLKGFFVKAKLYASLAHLDWGGFKPSILLAFFFISASEIGAQGPGRNTTSSWSTVERERILSLGPWPRDNTALDSPQRKQLNPLAGIPKAIALGEYLFKDQRLSANRKVSCETCHQAKYGFTDGRTVSLGIAKGQRNTMPLFDLAGQRWFGWDGGADSLWAASIRPMLDPIEMGGSASAIAQVLESDPLYASFLNALAGHIAKNVSVSEQHQKTLVIAAMSLAAWMDTIESERNAFDKYRDALARNFKIEAQASSASTTIQEPKIPEDKINLFHETGFSKEAERGLGIFIGKGNCWICHGGPNFTNGEFHDTGRPFMIRPKGANAVSTVDPGRHKGIERVKKDPYNLLGRWSPDPKGERAQLTDQTILQHRNWGEWKIPSLRNLKKTAPYMHDGSLATLREVVMHYSELNEERLHADGEALLKPLKLSEREITDLIAFLESLSP